MSYMHRTAALRKSVCQRYNVCVKRPHLQSTNNLGNHGKSIPMRATHAKCDALWRLWHKQDTVTNKGVVVKVRWSGCANPGSKCAFLELGQWRSLTWQTHNVDALMHVLTPPVCRIISGGAPKPQVACVKTDAPPLTYDTQNNTIICLQMQPQ